MPHSEIYRFACDFLALFLEPSTPPEAILETFQARCEALGFEMDYGKAFRAAFPDGSPLVRTVDFEAIAQKIDDAALLGSAIVSHWHEAQQWDPDSVFSKTHRSWFAAALARLADMTRPSEDSQIIVFPEIGALREEIQKLRDALAAALEEQDWLIHQQIPNLDARYRVMFGSLEYEIYRLDCSIRRLRRKMELIRAKLNRGEQANLRQIEATLDQEFAQYEEQMKKEMELYTNALERCSLPFLSAEETARMKHLYRTAVKALHPDLHPEQTQAEAALFHQATAAYEQGDVGALESICVLLEHPSDKDISASAEGTLAQLRSERDRLQHRLEATREKIHELKNRYPCTMEELLLDSNATENYQAELQIVLEQLREQEKRLRTQAQELEKSAAQPQM